ncbi:MAG: hypothetical protein M0Z63_08525 [Actinomycetota bacterium]|jgi:hypothetical protein|nr:hypothetical protein [Actinomycetota bacterium]
MSREGRSSQSGNHVAVARRNLVLRLAASDDSLHRVVTDLARKQVVIEELHFETGADTHWVHLLVRAEPARIDHAIAVLGNNVAVVEIVHCPSDAGSSET